mmetsp:Transcript_10218/g.18637  ORF Transcript_10218/g.18637 Transcript_10218/m.18637 type:complete len:254 (-) Transcript_10218:12-773(-)
MEASAPRATKACQALRSSSSIASESISCRGARSFELLDSWQEDCIWRASTCSAVSQLRPTAFTSAPAQSRTSRRSLARRRRGAAWLEAKDSQKSRAQVTTTGSGHHMFRSSDQTASRWTASVETLLRKARCRAQVAFAPLASHCCARSRSPAFTAARSGSCWPPCFCSVARTSGILDSHVKSVAKFSPNPVSRGSHSDPAHQSSMARRSSGRAASAGSLRMTAGSNETLCHACPLALPPMAMLLSLLFLLFNA